MYRREMFQNVIAVSNRKLCTRPFLEQIEIVCQYRPQALILREKDLSEKEYAILGEETVQICRKYSVPCIYHTFYEEAQRVGIKNIHLPLWKLRELSMSGRQEEFEQIGTSIHSVEEAQEAEKLGASYITAGHIFQTDCKPDLKPRGLEFLKKVCNSVSVPVYAIGGIHLEKQQLAEIHGAGAKGACIMSALMKIF